jgi:hypothetical protein
VKRLVNSSSSSFSAAAAEALGFASAFPQQCDLRVMTFLHFLRAFYSRNHKHSSSA